jgi:hypothetical protein
MSNWKQTLAAVAPTLAAALGGPLAGAAVNVIGKALLGEDRAFDEDMVSQAVLGANPDQLLALKNADNDFNVQMKKLDVENTKSARKFAVDTSIMPQVFLSIVYTVGYFLLVYALMSGEITIEPSIMPMVTTLLGVMTAAQAQIMNFWFGSSSGSKEKTSKLK